MGSISSLLDVTTRALFAQTQSIRAAGNNVSNVNTPGYSRRHVELVSVPGPGAALDAVGNGVRVNRVVRDVDDFLLKEQFGRLQDLSRANIRDEFLARMEAPFNVDEKVRHIGYELSGFYSALDDLQTSPASLPLRQKVIEAGNGLVSAIRSTSQTLAALQREADNKIGGVITEVNRLTTEIATVNSQITASETDEQQDLTLRDTRDQLLRELSEKIGFTTLENPDGTVNVTLQNGFGLVVGPSSKDLDFTNQPSFGTFVPGLDGGQLRNVVYDFDSSGGTSHVDLTGMLAASGGELGGLLTFRGVQSIIDVNGFQADGDIVEIAARVELIARDLLTRYNQTYRGPDENGGLAGLQPSAADLNGNTPPVFGLFDIDAPPGPLNDSDADGLATTADLAAYAGGVLNYSSLIRMVPTDPEDFAAARDEDPVAGATSFPQGNGANAAALSALRDSATAFSLGIVSTTTTTEGLYHLTVARAGAIRGRSQNDVIVAEGREAQVRELVSSVSGVSVDEEFAKLVNYQRAFQASARFVRISDELLNELIGLVSG